MKTPAEHADNAQTRAARERMLQTPGDPLVVTNWRRLLFLNYVIDPEVLRPHLPAGFELELFDGKAVVSLAMVTKSGFRKHPRGAIWGHLFAPIGEQRFVNLRIYGRCHGESGAYFRWGWLSRPFGLPLPDEPLGLTCDFADIDFDHRRAGNGLFGRISGEGGTLAYRGALPDDTEFGPAAEGSLERFAMERYSGFFFHHGKAKVFRAWHPPFLQARAAVWLTDDSLVKNRFPWFSKAQFVGASYTPGFEGVWIGRPHDLVTHDVAKVRELAVLEV
jgi:uncharacterized protein